MEDGEIKQEGCQHLGSEEERELGWRSSEILLFLWPALVSPQNPLRFF